MYINFEKLNPRISLDYNEKKRCTLQDRWDEYENYQYVIEKIESGGGEDFCQDELISDISEFAGDLRGIKLKDRLINGAGKDNFEGNIDFSYSRFENCTFENCTIGCIFNFVEFINCTFKNCIFVYGIMK